MTEFDPPLQAANPHMSGKAVEDAQYLMAGHGRFGETYYHGKADGDYGLATGLASYEAKFWCGYALSDCDHVFGSILYSYLLPLTSGLAVKLPISNRIRRAARLLAKKRQEQEYRNPYRGVSHLAWAGVDQGVDFSGSGPVYAVGPARVTVVTTNSGWPGGGAIAYTFTSGPKAGQSIYFVENITPTVRAGQIVNCSTVIAQMHNQYPYTECGWSHPATVDPIASLNPDPHSPKPEGRNFNDFLRSLGAPVGS